MNDRNAHRKMQKNGHRPAESMDRLLSRAVADGIASALLEGVPGAASGSGEADPLSLPDTLP